MKNAIFILFVLSAFVLGSCSKKTGSVNIRDYADNFKYKTLNTFDARNLPADLTEIDEAGLLKALWKGKDNFVKQSNYFYSMQQSPSGKQEFTVVLGDLDNKEEAKQIWYFIFDKEGKLLTRFMIAEYDKTADTYTNGAANDDGNFEVSYYQNSELVNAKKITVTSNGDLSEQTTDAKKEEKRNNNQTATTDQSNNTNVVQQEFYASDLFTQKVLVFAGLDLTRTVFVGRDFKDAEELKNKFFVEWNNVLLEEKKKFNVRGFFHKADVLYDFSSVFYRNGRRNTGGMLSETSAPVLSRGQVQNTVYYVGTTAKSGLGLVLVAESFDKNREEAVIWVTVFDLASKTVLISDRMTGKPKGAGMRNFWINAVEDVLNQVGDSRYKTWERTYK